MEIKSKNIRSNKVWPESKDRKCNVITRITASMMSKLLVNNPIEAW